MFGVICSSATALLLFSPTSAPWLDIDRAIRRLADFLFGRYLGSRQGVDPHRWDAAFDERSRLIKLSIFGLVLLFIFPLHAYCYTEWLIDTLWVVTTWLRKLLLEISWFNHSETWVHALTAHDWRDKPYEMWEVCVLIWTMIFLSGVITRDFHEKLELSNKAPEEILNIGSRLTWATQSLTVLGLLGMIVIDSGVIRLFCELGIVVIVAFFDLHFARFFANVGHSTKARTFLELFLIIDVPAICSFVVLLLFLYLCDLEGYDSHWSSPFVAGVSAFNLMFASCAILIKKVINSYVSNH